MEPSGFREIVRSATVTYPVPFAFATCLAFAVLAFGLAVLADGVLRWILAGTAGASVVFAFGLMGLAAAKRPELLRSERHEIMHRVLDFVEDSDGGPGTIEISRMMLTGARAKKASARARPRKSGMEDGQDAG